MSASPNFSWCGRAGSGVPFLGIAAARRTARRQIVLTFGASVLAPRAAFAQAPRKVWRIGLLSLSRSRSLLLTV